MFSSPALVAVFTAVFTVTGLYSLVRFAALTSGALACGDRTAELSHLLMSIAMLGMTWGFTGGPDTASGIVQLVVFGALAAWFAVRVALPGRHRRIGAGYHLLMQAAMVWMVAAMPALMGMSAAAGAAAGGPAHHGHGATGGMPGMAGMAGMSTSPTPLWTQVITLAVVALLGVAALAWASAALRPAPVLVTAPAGAPTGAPAGLPAAAAPAVDVPAPRAGRLNACCHLLMCLGMAGMLAAML